MDSLSMDQAAALAVAAGSTAAGAPTGTPASAAHGHHHGAPSQSLLATSLHQHGAAAAANASHVPPAAGPAPAPSRSRSRRAAPPQPQTLPPSATRKDMNGSWLLNKGRGNPSLRPFLEAMNVDHLAVEAAEKGEIEHDTTQEILLTDTRYRVHKLSRVNDLVLDLTLGEAKDEVLPKHPAAGTRTRRSYATSEGPRHVKIESTLVTVSGTGDVVDIKTLQDETGPDDKPLTVMQQILTVKNRTTGQTHTTTRYFVPYDGSIEKPATAGGSRRDRGELGPVAAKKKSTKNKGPSAQELLAMEQQQMLNDQPKLVGGHFTRSASGVSGEEKMEE